MALDDILAAIEQETGSRLEAIRQASAARQAEVRRRAETRAAAEEACHATSREAELVRARDRCLAQARQRTDRMVRSARERVFEAALARVRARLEGLREHADYPDLLRSLLGEARTALPTATRCVVDPRDVELVSRLAPDLEVRGVGTGWAGVMLEDDRARRVDNALHTRLEVALPEVRGLVGRHLPALWAAT